MSTQKALSAKQIEAVRGCNRRINIWGGAVRSGKTHSSLLAWIYELRNGPPGNAMMIGVTRESLQRNVLNELCEMIGMGAISSKNNAVTILGRQVYMIGANDEGSVRKIQGSTLSLAYIDEAAVIPEPFFRMLLSRLSKPGAKLFATCNPEGPHHWLKTDFIDKASNLDLVYWQFGLDDNPVLDEAYKANLKKEYSGHWYARFIEGEWAVASGLVYDSLTTDQITEQPFQDPNYYIAGIDYGTTNPTVCLLVGIRPHEWPQIRIEREYYFDSSAADRSKTDAELADDIDEFLKLTPVRALYVDPSAASLRLELDRRDLPVMEANNDVLPGIKVVSKFINQKNVIIRPECKNLIKELHSYSWDPKAASKGIDKVQKINDHACDSLRYCIASAFPDGELNNPNDNITIDEIRQQAYGFDPIERMWGDTGGMYR